MKDSSGLKIKAKTMTGVQAVEVLQRMLDRTSKKTYRRALEFAIDEMAGEQRPTKTRAAKA